MKNKLLPLSALLIVTTLSPNISLAANKSLEDHNPAEKLAQLPFENISVLEKSDLLIMREEEKLARDVYLTLYDKWNAQIFSKISGSEKKHMKTVGALLDKYSIPDPIKDDTIGVFENQELQDLYDNLIESGNKSLLDALKVGAKIEEMDIYDLEKVLKNTDNEDISKIYTNLQRASRNHLRAFDKQIKENNSEYSTEFISQSEYDSIAGSEKEKGNHGGKNKGGQSNGEKKKNCKHGSEKNENKGSGHGWKNKFQQEEVSNEHSLDEVRPRQKYRYGKNNSERGEGKGRGWGRKHSENSATSENLEKQEQSGRNFYHFFARFFR